MKRDINALLLMLFVTSVIKKKGHFSAQCYTKAAVTHVITEDAVYLSTVDTATLHKSSWCIPITLDNTKVMFKVDTGAEVIVISQETYKSLGRFAKPLEKPSKKLYGPACQPINS